MVLQQEKRVVRVRVQCGKEDGLELCKGVKSSFQWGGRKSAMDGNRKSQRRVLRELEEGF